MSQQQPYLHHHCPPLLADQAAVSLQSVSFHPPVLLALSLLGLPSEDVHEEIVSLSRQSLPYQHG